MAGGLALLRKLIGAVEGSKLRNKIGEKFLEGAEQPGTFQRGREFANTPESLEKQFGVRFLEEPAHDMTFVDPGVGEPALLLEQSSMRSSPWWEPEEVSAYLQERRTLPKVYEIDTSRLKQGSGAGTRVYPAMYGKIRLDPDAVNITSSLTSSNRMRRNANLGSAIMRDPSLGKRLFVDPEQLPWSPDVRPLEFSRMAPEEQLGYLQGSGALATLRNLELAAKNPEVPAATRGLLEKFPSLLDAHGSDVDQLYLMNDFLRSSHAPELRSIGLSSLKRAAMINDLAQDRPVNMELFRGLEFKRGGLATLADRR